MLDRTEIREVIHRALTGTEADELEVLFFGLDEALTRFANNEIHQNVAEANEALVIRAAFDQRIGSVSTNDLSREGINRAVGQAEALAKLQPETPDFPGFATPLPMPEGVRAFDEATAGASPDLRADAVGEVIRYAQDQDVNAYGAFRTSRYAWAVANTKGLSVYQPITMADLVIVAMTDTSSGYAEDASWRVDDIDVTARGREAVDKAVRAQNPRPLDEGVYPVVLEPYAALDILSFLGRGAGAMHYHEGRSWMSGRQGESLMDSSVVVEDVPLDPTLWPIAFDFEGVPRQSVTIVDRGAVGEVVYDRLWAAKADRASNGHALPAFSPFSPSRAVGSLGPMPMHLRMRAGSSSLSSMVEGIDRGLYVTRFNYTRVVHPREVVITGLTRDGTFLIEDGEITAPVRNLRFTQSYVDALSDVVAVGDTLDASRGYFGVSCAPALSLGHFRFTGTTDF
jgi:predicted Zn-dependent protease